MKYYRKNSSPLHQLREAEIRAGELVYNELGKCLKKVYVEDNIYFVEVVDSVLNEGEIMTNLTPLQLELFWKLSKNKLLEHENKNKNN